MDERSESTALAVTFDTNTLDAVVWPVEKPTQHGTKAERTIVRAAVQAGRIRGFFSETVITVEGIKNAERSEVLGQTRVLAEASALKACRRSRRENLSQSTDSRSSAS